MTAAGSRKVRRFVDFCDTFHLPMVSLVDEPGFMIGSAAERAGTIRFGAEAMFAVVQSTVPWASVIVRKTYGVENATVIGLEMCHIDRIKPDQGREQPPVGLGDLIPRKVSPLSQQIIHIIKCCEQFYYGLIIGIL